MADVPNYGLLTNMVSGVREGMMAYQTVQNSKRLQQQFEQTQQMQGLLNGVQKNADTGALEFTPERQEEIQSERKAKGLLAQHQAESLDPNSGYNQRLGANLKQALGPVYGQGFPGSGTESEYKAVAPLYEARMRADATKNMFGAKESDKANNDWEKFSEKVNDPTSRALVGRYQANLDKANTLDVLAKQIGMPSGQIAPGNETHEQRIARFNKADSRQLYEFAKAADQLTSSANSTVYGTDHLMPKDMDIAEAKFKEWLPTLAGGGKPSEANAGEFIDRYLDSAHREKGYYQSSKDKAIAGLSAGYSHLKSKDTNRWNAVLSNPSPQPGGLGQGMIQDPSAGGNSHPQDSAAVQWAKANPRDSRAAAILKANGQ